MNSSPPSTRELVHRFIHGKGLTHVTVSPFQGNPLLPDGRKGWNIDVYAGDEFVGYVVLNIHPDITPTARLGDEPWTVIVTHPE